MEDLDELFLANEAIRDLVELEDLNNQPRRRFHLREEAFNQLSDAQFIKMFRLSKHLTREVIEMVTPFIEPPSRISDVSIEAKVLAALNFYATGSYQNPIGKNIFVAMSQSSVARSVEEVTNALIRDEIINEWVKFPNNLQELRLLRTRFYQKYQLPGVVGCIDCTHVAIVPPQGDPNYPEHIYVNRKNYHSLNVQLICDDNLRILHINARFPGSTHDSYIWRQSNVSDVMEQIYRRNPNDQYYLIADSGYPLRPWLMTPLREPIQPGPEERYQNAFKTARSTIERCNGVLKGRFRCLLQDRTLHYHPVKASKIAKACAVLHNMCIMRRVPEIELNVDNILLEGFINEPVIQENAVNADLQRARIMQRNIIRTHFN